MITRQQYLDNSAELHTLYYLQFANFETTRFILSRIGMSLLLSSTDKFFNDIIKHSQGGRSGWVWNDTPIKLDRLKELGETNCDSTRTCVGKAVATQLVVSHINSLRSQVPK